MRPALRDLVRFDRSRITYVTAFQNALGVFAPFALGAATGHLLPGLGASIGALNVCFSDRPGPYGLRAGRMLVVALLGTLSALVGGLTGPIGWLTILLVALWALGGGMLVVFGPAAEQIGLTTIILLLVYGGFGLSPHDTLSQAGFIVIGGLFQTALSVIAWPFRQFAPERRALARVFRQLAAYTRAPTDPHGAPPVTAEMTAAGITLTGLGSAHSAAAEAFRVLLNEAERIRLELMALHHLRSDLLDEGRESLLLPGLDELWSSTGKLLDRIATAVERGDVVSDGRELKHAESSVESMRQQIGGPGRGDPVLTEILSHADALLGQLRACVEVASSGSADGVEQSAEAARPAARRLADSISVLRANLTLRSASFRHALRLAVTLVIATALARQFGLSRAYWVPLTVGIVLKPDFTSTFTRGVLRIAGTMVGLGLATIVVHLVVGDVAARIVLIGLLTFFIRSVGPANFGLSAVAVTALVVILTSFAGASPESTIHDRGIDTLIGGLLSLVAYALWPSWERARTPAVLADLLDAYRRYFDLVMTGYLDPRRLNRAELNRLRLEARLARSNAEASVDRMRSEPAGSAQDLDLAQDILANSHRFAQSAMALEAGLYTPAEPAVPHGLDRFAKDVGATLETLSSALRQVPRAAGPPLAETDEPADLRQDQNQLVKSAESMARASTPLLLETERITNSLNTMLDLLRRSPAIPDSPRTEQSAGHTIKHSADAH